ncbi:DUF4139 domain-containing protein [Sphingomonas sp. NIC1]|uniref:DUF4139 domain-containing protein n=1 Tax=Sphingomonas sp. NIC1 TaxID=1961362 RepID=UPI0007C0DBD6|nr:hypothetical protein [Sphingomonas sp. NIC1]ANC87453.1 hypothetical protein A7E77_11415 [Sphingomonas sp. NIC1]
MRALLMVLPAFIAIGAAPPPVTPVVVTSPAPAAVALTVYRAPYGQGAMNLGYLQGFALVTETRRIAVPKGASTLRFEGVAEGIVPVSAVVEGLPGGVIEKNRDARLLSPASLIDGTLGRTVTLTHTDRATGRRVSEQATIVAGPARGVVLKTRAGIETLRCSGLPERLSFAGVPGGLSAKPVLSVATVSAVARTVTVKLSYLASGFDWRSSYVATVAPDGRTLDLFAWLTLANANPERFPDAQLSAVAGRLNRVWTPGIERAVAALSLSCYPLGTTTSDLPEETFEQADDIVVTGFRMAAPPPPPPPPAPEPAPAPPAPENLGDLKLYRVPMRVTVAPRAQKQVALLSRAGVPFDRRYRARLYPGQPVASAPTRIVLALRNRRDAGLGLPLPAGSTAVYATRNGERLLLGQGALTDRAEGESFRIAAGISPQVAIMQEPISADIMRVVLTNAGAAPASVDVPIGTAGQRIEAIDATLPIVDGAHTWSVVVPAGGTAELRYRYCWDRCQR